MYYFHNGLYYIWYWYYIFIYNIAIIVTLYYILLIYTHIGLKINIPMDSNIERKSVIYDLPKSLWCIYTYKYIIHNIKHMQNWGSEFGK